MECILLAHCLVVYSIMTRYREPEIWPFEIFQSARSVVGQSSILYTHVQIYTEFGKKSILYSTLGMTLTNFDIVS